MTDTTNHDEPKGTAAPAKVATPSLNPPPRQQSGEFVYVGCKLPHGLRMELIPSWDKLKAPPRGPRFTLKGANTIQTGGILGASQGIHPYAITQVPKDFWDQWYERYKDSDYIKNGQIFVVGKNKKDAISEAANRVNGVKTGLEALQPDGDPRIKALSDPHKPETQVVPDKEQLARLYRGMQEGDVAS